MGIYKVVFETDSKLLEQWFQEKVALLWDLWDLCGNIQALLAYIDVEIRYIYKEGNTVADLLAKNRANKVNSQYFYISDLEEDMHRK